MTLQTQLITMGAFIVGGIYLGIANDTFRRFSSLWSKSRVLTYLLEILFWLSQVTILFYMLYELNYGEIRFYYFIALTFGFTVYITFFQSLYKKLLHLFIIFVTKMLAILYKLCVAPIIYIIRLLIRLLISILRIIVKIVIAIIKFILPEKFYQFITKKVAKYSTMIVILYNKLFSKKRK